MKTSIIVHSYHHNNTWKIAEVMAAVLGAGLKSALEAQSHDVTAYDLVGFGAGIDSGMHNQELLSYAKDLPASTDKKKCFIFSTSAVQGEKKVSKDHKKLRDILTAKGYDVIAEFSCKGFNTNSFLKHIGGMNKSHPDEMDLLHAKQFAKTLKQK